MPWTSEFDAVAGILYTRVSGALTFTEAVEHREQLAADPRFASSLRHLLDLRKVSQVALTSGELSTLANHSILSAPSRQAIVAIDDAVFGVSRMYDAYRSRATNHEEIAVCRSLQAAWDHLGVEPPAA